MEGERESHDICVDLLIHAICEKIFTLAILLVIKIPHCIAFV
jgi:hypothetical protein